MKNFQKNGFTLLELVIGISIILSVSVIFFKTIRLFNKETVFYNEHFVASALLEKVIEQSYQETEINPHGLKALGLVNETGDAQTSNSMITDGQDIFFKNPVINESEFEVLYHFLDKNFVLKIEPSKTEGFMELNACFNWDSKYGAGKSGTICRIIDFNGEKEVLSDLIVEDNEVESLLVQKMYNDTDSLSNHIPSEGALEAVQNIGRIYFTGFQLLSSSQFQQRCQNLTSLSSVASDLSSLEFLSEKYFTFASDLTHLMFDLEKSSKKALDKISFLDTMSLREKAIAQGYALNAGIYLQQMRKLFLVSILKLIKIYEQLVVADYFPRKKRFLVARLFNFYRIFYVNRDFYTAIGKSGLNSSVVRARYLGFLNRMQNYFADKDPSIARMAVQEKDFISRGLTKQMYFVPRFIFNIFEQADQLANYRF